MRTTYWMMLAELGVGMGAALISAGCFHSTCDDTATCRPGTGSGSSSTSSSSGTGGTPSQCIPSKDPKTAVDTSCGVFVSATGDDGATGAQDKPVQSLKQAVMLARDGEKRIYACAEELAGPVELPAGIAVYGGLDCGVMPRSWLYVGDKSKTTIMADAEMVPLTLASGTGTKLFDLHVLAKAAVNAGGSSIAVVADQVTAEIIGCVFEAGNGLAGAPSKGYTSAAQAGAMGNKGNDACMANTVVGGDPVASMCGGPDSSSGNGGSGFTASGGAGSPGFPTGATNGGMGEIVSACTPGMKGEDGAPGIPGPGATGLGAISKSGFAGVLGMPGLLGPPGQGGGGGGGAKGGMALDKCPVAGMTGGAAGGSGGSGGCGGAGGKGGNPGGSSIALISLGSSLTFSQVTLRTGKGGNGGDGGVGQDGGFGGPPGTGGAVAGMNGLNPGCNGGPGGSGGKGGKGGGGTGGHSIAIAFTGNKPVKGEWTATTGTFGGGGLGGDAAGEGAPGVKVDVQEFK